MRLTFWGAARTTTGSFHLVETRGRRFVLDCGLFQGRRADYYAKNVEFPVAADTVERMILSHAHVDHCGNIPTFAKAGFRAPILSTPASIELAQILLADSAMVQAKDVEFVNRKRARQELDPMPVLYTPEEAESVFPQFQPVPYYRQQEVLPGVQLRFLEAGHILGSAQVQLDIDDGGPVQRRLVFSGDIGRGKSEILRAPDYPADVDTLIMESTYGNRATGPVERMREELLKTVKRVAERGGKVIVPAFSVGRTQDIVFHLNNLFNEGKLPRIPIFVDSPMSANVTEVFKRHPECFNRQMLEIMQRDKDPFGFDCLIYTRSAQDSMALNDIGKPCVIISASGMCEAGRILHHLRNSVGDPKNCVLIVGYQAEHTLGRRLVEKHPRVKIFGEEHEVHCEVAVLNGFSAHADMEELREYAFRVREASGGRLKDIFLVHGEPEASDALADYIRTNLKVRVHTPSRGDAVDL